MTKVKKCFYWFFDDVSNKEFLIASTSEKKARKMANSYFFKPILIERFITKREVERHGFEVEESINWDVPTMILKL